MRDLDRWKDKVELSLDGRQIFFLFFGSAVAACLIFVVGVLIGKRLEARALALEPPPVEDPLAALDQLGDADDTQGLTFHKALTGAQAKSDRGSVEKTMTPPASPPAAASVLPPPPVAHSLSPSSGVVSSVASASSPGPLTAASATASASMQASPPVAPPAKPVAPRPNAAPPRAPVAQPSKPSAPLPAGKPQVVQAQKTPPAGHFTLQLSAFPERSQADEFAHKLQAAGYRPYIVASAIPGKGVFYRVRVGDYMTKDAAAGAKTEFERRQHTIAYVAKL